ncbi:MAG TPA: MlaD family protein [Thermoleophilaceae bacterium]
MSNKRASIVASPVLIGGVTVLIVIVAVFLAYNSNQGLPFVPTYDINVELPNGAKLVKGNSVRIGGNNVGQISELRPVTITQDGQPVTVALAKLKLKKSVQPLPKDTIVTVRDRSALGLKYLDLIPGNASEGYKAGATVPLANARARVDLEDVLSTFDEETRVATQQALVGYGDAFTARGADLNVTIGELPSLTLHLRNVMENLSAPSTQLNQLFKQIGAAAAQVAPIANVQVDLLVNLRDTLAALSRDPRALQDTIAKTPGTLQTGIESFRVQQPFLAHFTALSRDLEPATAALPSALPPLSRALAAGVPTLSRSVPRLSSDTKQLFTSLADLSRDPATLVSLRQLETTVNVGAPAVQFLAPYQTVCNYFNYFFDPLGEHLSEPVERGTIERIGFMTANMTQDNSLAAGNADRPADVPANEDPHTAQDAGGALTKLNTQFGGPAIDKNGNADCQAGQTGYPVGPLNAGGRYPPSNDPAQGGGSHIVVDPNTPGNAGGTYVTRKLGIKNLKDVP